MPYTDYIKHTDDGLATQMINFRNNVPGELAALGLLATDADIVQQALDATRFRAVVDFHVTMQAAAQGWTAEKNFERDGGSLASASQTVPVLPQNFPSAVPPGILPRFRTLAQRIKGMHTYTVAIGEALGIEGPGVVAHAALAGTAQPVAHGRALVSGGAEIKSTKGDAEAVDVYGQRDGDAAPVHLARVLHLPYVDARPLLVANKPETREYHTVFVRNDQQYGQPSAIIKVVVTG
ncbi:MAG: hypothetical protein WCS42_23630 [Verrucomicrobiota bacterium]